MVAKNVTLENLKDALVKVNENFDNNIVWKRSPEKTGKRFTFTLTVLQTAAAGGRRGFQGQRVAAACWHVHGEFFDFLFAIEPKAEIRTAGRVITKTFGNWKDFNAGSLVTPKKFSEMCDC